MADDPDTWNDKAALWRKVGPVKSQVTQVCTSVMKLTAWKFDVSALQYIEKYRDQLQRRFDALTAMMDQLTFF